ncbi:MAG: hypothetical protein EPO08_04490 [Rhodospirillaceae bacterium]|nr:MAG: hypothetical protein EPO08_04490 [Rhodospirillaceae bacterium]
MVTRIATATNNDAQVASMLALQSKVNTEQQQMSSGLVSQDYVGVSGDAFRLLNIESQQARLNNYISNNASTTTNLQTQLTSVQSINSQATTIQGLLVTASGQDFASQSPNNVATIQDIQQKAFSALSQITYFLNQKVDGQYVFGGGQSNTQPVNFPYGSLGQFQQTFDGINTVFPSTRVADMTNIGFNNVAVNYTPATVGGTNYTEVSAAPNSFITQTLTSAGFGSLNFTNIGANGKVTASIPGAFKSLQVGQTISFDNTASGTNNNGIYTVTAVSPDGNSITLDQNVNAGVEPVDSTKINLLVPNGTAMALSGSAAGNNGAKTITWPTNAQLAAAGFSNGDGAPPQDGSTLFINPQVPSAVSETISLNSTSFLTGANITTQQKISDTQSINLDVTALDPAFEKVIRGLGILAQGNLINNPSRISQALGLIDDGISHSSLSTTEQPSDLTSVENKLSLNLKTLSDTTDQQNQLLAFLGSRQNDILQANPTTTAVKLNSDSNSLQVSYATLAKIQNLSLLNYL